LKLISSKLQMKQGATKGSYFGFWSYGFWFEILDFRNTPTPSLEFRG
jgi:hypothetical protein